MDDLALNQLAPRMWLTGSCLAPHCTLPFWQWHLASLSLPQLLHHAPLQGPGQQEGARLFMACIWQRRVLGCMHHKGEAGGGWGYCRCGGRHPPHPPGMQFLPAQKLDSPALN